MCRSRQGLHGIAAICICTPRRAMANVRVRRERWYVPGLLHCGCGRRRGLDFIAITDHNATSQYNPMRELQPYFDKLLLIPDAKSPPSTATSTFSAPLILSIFAWEAKKFPT